MCKSINWNMYGPKRMSYTWTGGGDNQLERQQVYTDKWTEVGSGREGRRGVAGAGVGIFTLDFVFIQSACFHSSVAPSSLIALKRHEALSSALTRHIYPKFATALLVNNALFCIPQHKYTHVNRFVNGQWRDGEYWPDTNVYRLDWQRHL